MRIYIKSKLFKTNSKRKRLSLLNYSAKSKEEEHLALKQLAKDNSIIISKADKGNVIVMQDKVDYTNKLFKLIFKLKTIMIVRHL